MKVKPLKILGLYIFFCTHFSFISVQIKWKKFYKCVLKRFGSERCCLKSLKWLKLISSMIFDSITTLEFASCWTLFPGKQKQIPRGPQLIRQFLIGFGGLFSQQSTKSVHANTLCVAVYYFCYKSHLCVVILWRMSNHQWKMGMWRGRGKHWEMRSC